MAPPAGRLLHGDEPCLVLRRVEQNSLWQQRWQQQQSLLRRRQEQALLCRTPEEFQSLTNDRQQELGALASLLTLSAGLSADLPIPDWQVLLDQEPFTLARPVMPHPRPFPPSRSAQIPAISRN